MTTNPLLCVQTQNTAPLLLQVVYTPPTPAPVSVANVSGSVYTATAGPPLSVSLVTATPGTVVSSISEAEDLFLTRIFEAHKTPGEIADISPAAGDAGDRLMEAMIKINRASVRIAARTRRGCGNTVLMNESTFEAIRSLYRESGRNILEMVSSEPQNGWQHVGTINTNIDVYTSNKIPPGKAVVLYKGKPHRMKDTAVEFDGPAVFHEGETMTLTYNDGGNRLGNSDDYTYVVEIITENSSDYSI